MTSNDQRAHASSSNIDQDNFSDKGVESSSKSEDQTDVPPSDEEPQFKVINNFYGEVKADGAAFGIKRTADADPSNIQEVAAAQLQLSTSYYQGALSQAQRSFLVATVSASVGFIFFLGAVLVMLLTDRLTAATTSVVAGAIVETIAGLNFWLYARVSSQLEAFHIRLEQTQRYLLANSVCLELSGDIRDTALAELAQTISKQPVHAVDNNAQP